MRILNVKLVARSTAASCPNLYGHCIEMQDDVPLGKVYRVDMDRGGTAACGDCGRIHKMVKDAEAPGYLPMELLNPFEP